jgi:hypothetical protein
VETKFSRVEMESAKYLQMVPTWHHGYPEPSADFGYLHKTYETTNYCRVCGIGLNQVAPFRLKREPTWGKNSILQLNWVFDEYFVKPQVSRALLNELEIGPVIGDKSGRDLADVVQFIVGGRAKLNLQDSSYEICGACDRKKYVPHTRGFFPLPEENEFHIFKSHEYFGSGALAYRAILVSRDLYHAITSNKLKGVEFKPCAPSPFLL